ncbi:Acetyl-coenzyme A carboxylase carboxyl transferase subunit alpha [compost metagenome]
MSRLEVPVIVIVIGEGSSGGALAIGVGDTVIMLENAIYSILSPEGYASILWKDSSRAEEASKIMKLTAEDLYELNVIDKVIEEPEGGADKDINSMSEKIKEEIVKETKKLSIISKDALLEKRYQKFRNMGQYEEVI